MKRRHKKPRNSFYKLKLPTKVHRDWRNKCWELIDSNNTIIADNLTKEIAETLEQAVNIVGEALTFLTLLLKYENMVCPTKKVAPECIKIREDLVEEAIQFLVNLGIIEMPPEWGSVFGRWKDDLMNDFYESARL